MTVLDRKDFVELITKLAESVYDFHARFNLFENMPDDLIPERILLTAEELGEMSRAYMREGWDQTNEEAADLLYIALGTVLFLGGDGAEKTQDVIEKNAKKTSKTHTVNTAGKVVKLMTATNIPMTVALVEQARCEICRKFVVEGKKRCINCKSK